MSEIIIRQNDDVVDEIEAQMAALNNAIDCPLDHVFTKGLYSRTILMCKREEGLLHVLTSRIHKTQHQFFIFQGKLSISIDGKEWQYFEAPCKGVTLPGTRRILAIYEDTIFTTVHPLPFITGEENNWSEEKKNELLLKIENVLLEKHENKLISQTKTIEPCVI